jgi:hypothetical protein
VLCARNKRRTLVALVIRIGINVLTNKCFCTDIALFVTVSINVLADKLNLSLAVVAEAVLVKIGVFKTFIKEFNTALVAKVISVRILVLTSGRLFSAGRNQEKSTDSHCDSEHQN